MSNVTKLLDHLRNREPRSEKLRKLFREHNDAGRNVVRRISALRGAKQEELDREQWVPGEEVSGWYATADSLVSRAFAKKSEQVADWNRAREEASETRSISTTDPVDIWLDHFQPVKAKFESLIDDPDLGVSAKERLTLWIENHPTIGPLLAVLSVLGLVAGIVTTVLRICGFLG